MQTMTKEQAVKSAGERLGRLEDGMRRLFWLATATIVLAGITASISLFGAYRYWQVTTAISRTYDAHQKSLANIERVSRHP